MSVIVDQSSLRSFSHYSAYIFFYGFWFVAYSYVNYYCNLNYLIPIVIILFCLLIVMACHCIYLFQLLKYVKDASGIQNFDHSKSIFYRPTCENRGHYYILLY